MINIIKKAIQTHKDTLTFFENTQIENVVNAANLIIDAVKNGSCLYLCGNGGSAADAQHVAGEIVGRFLKERKGFPAIALTTDSTVLTAIANDYGYESVFNRQVEALVKPNDILWAFSTSGTSSNIISAVKIAKEKGAKIIAFTGKENTDLQKLSDVCIIAPAPYSAPAQEIHQLAYHAICELIEIELSKTEQ